MPRLSDLTRLDWAEIKHRALTAGAATLAEAARRRAATEEGTIEHAVTQDDRATVRATGAALVRREHGDAGLPPAPFLAPDTTDAIAVRAAIAESLGKDLA